MPPLNEEAFIEFYKYAISKNDSVPVAGTSDEDLVS